MPTQVTHKKEYKHHTDALQKTHAPEKKTEQGLKTKNNRLNKKVMRFKWL